MALGDHRASDALAEKRGWRFAYVFAPLPIVGATGSPGTPFAML